MQFLFGGGSSSTSFSRSTGEGLQNLSSVESLFLTQVLSFLKNTYGKNFQFNENSSYKNRSHLEMLVRVVVGILFQDYAAC